MIKLWEIDNIMSKLLQLEIMKQSYIKKLEYIEKEINQIKENHK
jgi:hypothetical protein